MAMKHAMSADQLSNALAEALNILNDIRSDNDLSQKQHGYIENLLAQIPAIVLDCCDYRNNGSVSGSDLLFPRKY